MDPLEYELPNNLKKIQFYSVQKICNVIHVANTMFTEITPLVGIMLFLWETGYLPTMLIFVNLDSVNM